jgi:hypothetical protein
MTRKACIATDNNILETQSLAAFMSIKAQGVEEGLAHLTHAESTTTY